MWLSCPQYFLQTVGEMSDPNIQVVTMSAMLVMVTSSDCQTSLKNCNAANLLNGCCLLTRMLRDCIRRIHGCVAGGVGGAGCDGVQLERVRLAAGTGGRQGRGACFAHSAPRGTRHAEFAAPLRL